jgi:hypothetical protein
MVMKFIMKNGILFLALFFASFFSCSKRLCGCDPDAPPIVKAVVVEENNIDCNRPLVVIEHTDTAYIRNLTGHRGDTFVASQLPAALKLAGQKLYISPAVFASGEDFFCTTIGPSYPHLKIVTATAR